MTLTGSNRMLLMTSMTPWRGLSEMSWITPVVVRLA